LIGSRETREKDKAKRRTNIPDDVEEGLDKGQVGIHARLHRLMDLLSQSFEMGRTILRYKDSELSNSAAVAADIC
jgi:hypothetical protein